MFYSVEIHPVVCYFILKKVFYFDFYLLPIPLFIDKISSTVRQKRARTFVIRPSRGNGSALRRGPRQTVRRLSPIADLEVQKERARANPSPGRFLR